MQATAAVPVASSDPDSAALRDRARDAQAGFERRRVRLLPFAYASYGGGCDETVGRFCSWYSEGEWVPEPEPEGIVRQRQELLALLDSVQTRIPGDAWVLGQRVWYRAEAGQWRDALRASRGCGVARPGRWWCAALEGFALHGMGRFVDAERAFGRALGGMDPERARLWRVPRRAVDGRAEELLERAPPDSLEARLRRLWTLADPLYLVQGNDRLTAHYARWTVVEMKSEARNPFQLSWGRDLEELTVRNGWEMGWEREWSRDLGATPRVVGHKHPQGRDFMPAGRALEDPAGASPEALLADRSRPRSLYAPVYAPLLLPMDGQVALFPRGDSLAVVATTYLPPDTTLHAVHAHPRPWMEAGDQAGEPDRSGLFLVPAEGGGAGVRFLRPGAEGAGVLRAPAGAWVLSAESWSPSGRRAGRLRRGVRSARLPPDVPTLSDLFFVAPRAGDPASLEAAAAEALPSAEVPAGQPFAVVWEVSGIGWRPERLRYSVSMVREDRGLLRRIGGWLGLAGDEETLVVSWEERGPGAPARLLRRLVLDSAAAEPGRYRVRVRLDIPGREGLASEAALRLTSGGAGAR